MAWYIVRHRDIPSLFVCFFLSSFLPISLPCLLYTFLSLLCLSFVFLSFCLFLFPLLFLCFFPLRCVELWNTRLALHLSFTLSGEMPTSRMPGAVPPLPNTSSWLWYMVKHRDFSLFLPVFPCLIYIFLSLLCLSLLLFLSCSLFLFLLLFRSFFPLRRVEFWNPRLPLHGFVVHPLRRCQSFVLPWCHCVSAASLCLYPREKCQVL
jgi:hypothetical protein